MEVPGQTAPEGEALMVTLTGKFGLTVIVMALEVAGLPVAQVALEVNTHVITSPLAKVAVVYVGLLDPTLVELRFH